MIRVLIVDSQPEVRRGLHMRLAIEPEIAVVGETGDIEQALAMAHALGPDVVVADLGSRRLASVEIIQRLREASPQSAVVVLTLGSDEDTRSRAREAGAQAFLEKGCGAADLLETIRHVAARRLPVSEGGAAIPSATRQLGVG